MKDRTVPVVIVGAGPTGLAVATLLAQCGIESLVLERETGVYPRPRAVHLDDEVHRILARLGIGDEFAAVSRPCLGLRLVEPDMRVLAEFRRSAAAGPHGFPEANMFDQPDLEHLLRANLARHPEAELREGTEVTAIAQPRPDSRDHAAVPANVQTGSPPVRVDFTDLSTGERGTVRAEYLLGCDGADSLVRRSIGASMRDLRFAQRWLVVDLEVAAELGQWEGVHQVCDPARAATYMRVGKTRHRWEFRLQPGQGAADYQRLDTVRPLIEPWIGDLPDDRLELVRVADYTFRAQLADRWRHGRAFLLGDAAHLTPPFIGQGIGAGLRDAANLAWKLAAVLQGELPETVLDTYQTERGPHARTMIRLAKVVGAAMTGGGETGRLIRRVIAPRLHLVPGLRERVLTSETPALSRSDLVRIPRLGRGLAGQLCPNAPLGDGRRFDEAAAGRFAIVTATRPSESERAAIAASGAVLVTTEPGEALHAWLRQGRATAALVRPDGTVMAAGPDPARLAGFRTSPERAF